MKLPICSICNQPSNILPLYIQTEDGEVAICSKCWKKLQEADAHFCSGTVNMVMKSMKLNDDSINYGLCIDTRKKNKK